MRSSPYRYLFYILIGVALYYFIEEDSLDLIHDHLPEIFLIVIILIVLIRIIFLRKG